MSLAISDNNQLRFLGSILFISGLIFTSARLSPEAPKHSEIFDFFMLTEPECSHFSTDYHSV
jgi:hypothetical protein